ncbi:Ras-related C3 Botulinum toxin substrate 1 [Aphelenchoides besseyi]|nr:Ras-related C3 Botulinum toxin substrate 1 [Aphelenchoides besseyi]KAI6208826.1 Ras-related C3 Botulinum toxin substrate 1 [Aphelenchoides besseyi]
MKMFKSKKSKKTEDSKSISIHDSLSPPASSILASVVEELPAVNMLIIGDKGVGKTALYRAFGRQNRRQLRAAAHRERCQSITSNTTSHSSSSSSTSPSRSLNGDLIDDAKNVDDYLDFQAGELAENLVKFRVYDSAGHHLPAHPVFARSEKIDVVLCCFALDSLISLENVEVKWKPELAALCPNAILILVGTKVDLRDKAEEQKGEAENEELDEENKPQWKLDLEKMVTTEVGVQMADDIEAAAYAECSSQAHKGIVEIFNVTSQLIPRKRVGSIAQKILNGNTQLAIQPHLHKRHLIARFGMGMKRKWYRAVFIASTVAKWTRGKINIATSAISSMFVILTGIILGLFY